MLNRCPFWSSWVAGYVTVTKLEYYGETTKIAPLYYTMDLF